MGKGKGKVKGKLVKNVHKHKCMYKVHNFKIEFSCKIFTEFSSMDKISQEEE